MSMPPAFVSLQKITLVDRIGALPYYIKKTYDKTYNYKFTTMIIHHEYSNSLTTGAAE